MQTAEALKKSNADLKDYVLQRSAALNESEERYILAINGSNEGIWDWIIASGEVYYSSRWYDILGLNEKNFFPNLDTWMKRVYADDREALQRAITRHIEGAVPDLKFEHRILHQDGSYRWVMVRGLAVRDEEGRAVRIAGSMNDITRRKVLEDQLRRAALHDTLTGLPNRALLMDRLGRVVERLKRRKDVQFAILSIDIDHFKLINDSYGHTLGDQLLVAFARRLESCLRMVDTVARPGGDQLVVLLEDVESIHEAVNVAERFLEDLNTPFVLGEHEFYVSASIGITMNTAEFQSTDDFLQDAETAMYRAKSQGRGRYEIYDKSMRSRALQRIMIENELCRAVERNEFVVYYQPLVNLKTGKLSGFEALVRWQHPERGLMFPGDFIDVAEESGLIVQMDMLVLREACRQTSEWQQRFRWSDPLTISVNLSGLHFSQLSLVTKIEQILDETGLSPLALELEITESTLIQNSDMANSILSRLIKKGIRLHMDDFGTGYSSLSYLHRFPFHTLKIDRSFIHNVSSTSNNLEIVQAIVTLAKNLGLQVIAEGIETVEDLRFLQTMSCQFGQGYLFSRPVSGEEACQLFESTFIYMN